MKSDDFEPRKVAFSVLDLDACLAFRTESSVSFDVEWNSNDHEGKFRKGRIDVHHPCEGRVEAVIRVSLNEPYPDWESQSAILEAVFQALRINREVTFQADFFTPTQQVELSNDPNAWYSYLGESPGSK